MAIQEGEDVYVSLLLTDTYLPGALVLAHSLRDGGTKKKIAILVTPDSVSPDVISILKDNFDYVIPVDRIRNDQPANLSLMNRPDLHSAFTKINLWKQTQFRKIVYIDADVVAYRAPDELFDLPHAFSAAPDIGWPDLFNTGVMALTPNMGDYNALIAMAERGISFDGADQGLLNMHFQNNYHRLPFTYNVTPSAHYQYVPAYRHFQSSINLVHFIGPDKPWRQGRESVKGDTAYGEIAGKWWAVYDRHYHNEDIKTRHANGSVPGLDLIRYFVRGEYQPNSTGWDAQNQPPPPYSKPEALNFPQKHYEMSSDTSQFVSPTWHDSARPKPIFPWEQHQPRPSRVFPDEYHPPQPLMTEVMMGARSPLDSPTTDVSTVASRKEPQTPPSPNSAAGTSEHWSAISRGNAWDEVPEIHRYVDSIQKHRRKSQTKSDAQPDSEEQNLGAAGSRVTDFPSELDRPSLPVTPAPIRRPNAWSGDGSGPNSAAGNGGLPAAAGVPPQSDWDPVVQLQELAKNQSELLLQKFGTGADAVGTGGKEIPSRSLPFGSEAKTASRRRV